MARPLPVDSLLALCEKAPLSLTVKRKPREDKPLQLPTSLPESYEEAAEELAEALRAACPETGHRHELAGALAGALCSTHGVHRELIPALVGTACRLAGFGTLQTKYDLAKRTVQLKESGEPVTGFGRLREEFPLVADAVNSAFPAPDLSPKQKTTAAPRTASAGRRVKDPNHRYTVNAGDRPNGEKTNITRTKAAAEIVAHDAWEGVLQFNELALHIEAVNPPIKLDAEEGGLTKQDGVALNMWFEVATMYKISPDGARDAAIQVAKVNRYHPIREFLEALPVCKNPEAVFDGLCLRLFGNKEPMAQVFLRKWLIAAVARVYQPGCFVKNMLVLVGQQDAGKSTFCKTLFYPWFKEDISDIRKKDALEELRGVWGVELGELKAVRKADVETLKTFISKAEDHYRKSFGEDARSYKRQCVFCGTTDTQTFLRDPAGDVRFWPIQLPDAWKIPSFDREEIWGAALACYKAGESWHLTREESEAAEKLREPHYEMDPWHDLVVSYLSTCKSVHVRAEDVYKYIAGAGFPNSVESRNLDVNGLRRVQDILRRICGPAQPSNGVRQYRIPGKVATEATVVKLVASASRT